MSFPNNLALNKMTAGLDGPNISRFASRDQYLKNWF